MQYKCHICGTSEVDYDGAVCELCAIGQDPYLSAPGNAPSRSRKIPINGGAAETPSSGSGKSRKVLLNAGTDDSGKASAPTGNASGVRVYKAGQVPTVSANNGTVGNTAGAPTAKQYGSVPITSGIIKNVTNDVVVKSAIVKWAESLFKGVPFSLDNDVTSFQVFPDYGGTALNASGNACDQVIVLGKITSGTVSENNTVEVFGKRDSRNNIIASTIRNTASGSTVSAIRTLPPWIVRLITLAIIGLAVLIIYSFKNFAVSESAHTIGIYAGGILIAVALIALGLLFFKISIKLIKWSLLCFTASAGVILYLFFPALLTQILVGAAVIGAIIFAVKLFKR